MARILVVEDCDAHFELLERWLLGAQHSLERAQTLKEAIQLSRKPFDLALVDQILPGTELSQAFFILDYKMRCPVIPITSFTNAFNFAVGKEKEDILKAVADALQKTEGEPHGLD